MQSLVKKYSMPDIEQKFEARSVSLEREIARQTDKSQKIEQLLLAVRENIPEIYSLLEQYVNPPTPPVAVYSSKPSTPVSASRTGTAQSPKSSTPNGSRLRNVN